MHTTSLSDWLSGLSAGMAGLALLCLVLALADPDSGCSRLLVLLAAASREFGRDAAALLILLTTSPKGELA